MKTNKMKTNKYYKTLINEYNLSEYDALVISESKEMYDYFIELCQHVLNVKKSANWIMGPLKKHKDQNSFKIPAIEIAKLINKIDLDQLSNYEATREEFPILLKKYNENN